MPIDILRLVWTLLVIVVVLVLAYLFTRFMAGQAAGGPHRFRRGRFTVLDQVSVGKDQKLLLVQLKDQVYFLGAAQGGITCLDKLPAEELTQGEEAAGQQNPSFSEALQQVVNQWKKSGRP